MNIYFSGIGGVGIGPLAEIALDAGHHVVGSDQGASAMSRQLEGRGVDISSDQDGEFLATQHAKTPFDWFIYTAALPSNHPELVKAKELGIRVGKRDELLVELLREHNLKLVAISGTHGKTTTTGMMIWTFKQLGVPVSYAVGTTLSFGPSGVYDPASEYFVYECDEFDRNMLKFEPYLSVLTTIGYDHSDTYASPDDYLAAFSEFVGQSGHSIGWKTDLAKLSSKSSSTWQLADDEVLALPLPGMLSRRNATLVAKACEYLGLGDAASALASFPGTNRRFEKLAENLYSDYAHHPDEIAATLQMAREISDHVVVVYQPHQNIRQHEVRDQYTDCFELAEEVFWLPTYQSREDPALEVLTPQQLSSKLTNAASVKLADLDNALWDEIQRKRDEDKLVLCMGAGSIDAWLRENMSIGKVGSVIVIDTDNNFVLQQRDDKPTISFPGTITGFGGAIENDESLREGAARELAEETNLDFDTAELEYCGTFYQTGTLDGKPRMVSYYVLRDADTSNIEVYEGQGAAKIPLSADTSVYNLAPSVPEALARLTK
ncbi:MAG TPA: Mur ligase domain-containing protein [Candidatus Saccharibacteria bacterium]|nr:Mur ligase domain-containing protein [Candidatus Saccharibacteria bacterium]